jgi:hypothetical protein
MPAATIEGMAKDMLIVRAQDGSVQRITLGVPVREVAAGEGLQSVTSLIGRKIGISKDGSEFYFFEGTVPESETKEYKEIERPKVMNSREDLHLGAGVRVGGKKKKKYWMQDAFRESTEGDLHRALGVSEDHVFTIGELEEHKKALHEKAEKGPLSKSDLHLLHMLVAAITAMRAKKGGQKKAFQHRKADPALDEKPEYDSEYLSPEDDLPLTGYYVCPDGWGPPSGGGKLLPSDWEGSQYFLPVPAPGPVKFVAVNVKVEGEPQRKWGALWQRVKIEFVGDDGLSEFSGGWVLVKPPHTGSRKYRGGHAEEEPRTLPLQIDNGFILVSEKFARSVVDGHKLPGPGKERVGVLREALFDLPVGTAVWVARTAYNGSEYWSVRPMRTSMAARREQAEERQHSHYEVSPIRSLLEDLLKEGGYTEQDGFISSPGKFEGEPVEVLYYYHLMEEGDSSDDGEGWAAFEVTPEEAEEFDLSPDEEVAVLTEDESGSVSLAYTTQENFEKFRDSQEEFGQDDFSLGEDEESYREDEESYRREAKRGTPKGIGLGKGSYEEILEALEEKGEAENPEALAAWIFHKNTGHWPGEKANRPRKRKSSQGGRHPSRPMRSWDVLLDGEVIDRVHFDDDMRRRDVYRSLVEHDGYPPDIEVSPRPPHYLKVRWTKGFQKGTVPPEDKGQFEDEFQDAQSIHHPGKIFPASRRVADSSWREMESKAKKVGALTGKIYNLLYDLRRDLPEDAPEDYQYRFAQLLNYVRRLSEITIAWVGSPGWETVGPETSQEGMPEIWGSQRHGSYSRKKTL